MRIEQITFTRFLAAVSIVIFHFGQAVFPFNTKAISFLFSHADIGVSYFFILSGFVMMIAYGEKEKVQPGNYYRNRLARIYPVYFLALVTYMMHGMVFSYAFSPVDFGLNAFLLQSWFPGRVLLINGPGWSLSVEAFFYLLFPFFFNFLYRKVNYKKLIFFIACFWLATQVLVHALLYSGFYRGFPSASHDFIFYNPFLHLNQFLIGNVAGLFFMLFLKNKPCKSDWAVIGIIILFFLILKYNPGLDLQNGLLAIIFIPLILFLSMNNGIISKLFNHKSMIWLGEISYGIYILQFPVYLWMSSAMSRAGLQNPTVRFYLYLILLIVFSGLSYTYIETPLRNRIKTIGKRKKERK
ncbi:MAG: acyltransferase [Candidatus Azobacteroides sp.]|nr:acyltransferase [Candidatus Azobacteroides sp.]